MVEVRFRVHARVEDLSEWFMDWLERSRPPAGRGAWALLVDESAPVVEPWPGMVETGPENGFDLEVRFRARTRFPPYRSDVFITCPEGGDRASFDELLVECREAWPESRAALEGYRLAPGAGEGAEEDPAHGAADELRGQVAAERERAAPRRASAPRPPGRGRNDFDRQRRAWRIIQALLGRRSTLKEIAATLKKDHPTLQAGSRATVRKIIARGEAGDFGPD
jgi:hypothetical protein